MQHAMQENVRESIYRPTTADREYDHNLSHGMTSPWANELSYILHVRDDIAVPKSWENLGIGPGFLEVVDQQHTLENLEKAW